MKLQTSSINQRYKNSLLYSLLLLRDRILPIQKFTVQEESMIPFLKPGDVILINKLSYVLQQPKISNIVVVKHPRKDILLIKRISDIKGDRYFVTGDNLAKSTDSRTFGWITKHAILGKMIYKLL